MKNIQQILDSVGGLTDEQVSAIVDGVTANYRTISEMEQKAAKVAELESENESMKDAISKLKITGAEAERLQKLVDDYEAAEEERKAREDEERRLREFAAAFDDAVKSKNREFSNDFMREAILSKVREKCAQSEGMGISDAIEAVTNDVPGVWKSPQAKIEITPGANGTDEEAAERKRLADFMFN